MVIYWSLAMVILGAAMGSFAAASVWRIRAQGLVSGEEEVEDKTDKSLRKLFSKKKTINEDRSVCLSCRKPIAWYDLIPILSWFALGGKCRHCKKPIGRMEIVSEVGLALAFVVSYLVFNQRIGFDSYSAVIFIIWLAILVVLAIQWMYDARWHLLITTLTMAMTVLAITAQALAVISGLTDIESLMWGVLFSLVIMPGLYYALYKVSGGQWVGLGDVYLLVPFAILIADWQQAFLLVFLANLLGCVYMVPAMLSKRARRGLRIPFGPFLIAAFFIVVLWGDILVGWYLRYALLTV